MAVGQGLGAWVGPGVGTAVGTGDGNGVGADVGGGAVGSTSAQSSGSGASLASPCLPCPPCPAPGTATSETLSGGAAIGSASVGLLLRVMAGVGLGEGGEGSSTRGVCSTYRHGGGKGVSLEPIMLENRSSVA
jgi:hypothetical protein